jgi:pimeloyl-ACP methyl ester carboxylesterase
MTANESGRHEHLVEVPTRSAALTGTLGVPAHAAAVVLFAHGSGSSRFSPRNQYVAQVLRDSGLATLLLDLLSPSEERVDEVTRQHRFDIRLLATRLVDTIDWLGVHGETRDLPVGLFGASTGGGAALAAAAERPDRVIAVVSRGGRPDLAGEALPAVSAPTLLIVGALDEVVIALNEAARDRMRAPVRLAIVPGATHLFQERGALEQVAEWAGDFFRAHI